MGVASRHLVFDVVAGLLQLAHVVEVAADTDEEGVSADEVGRPLGKVAQNHAMMERPRRLVLEPAQQRLVELGQFHELDAGSDAEKRPQCDESPCRQHAGYRAADQRR